MRLLRSGMLLLAPCVVGAATLAPGIAEARSEQRQPVAIPSGTLDQALRELSRQTGIAVGGTVSGIANVATPTVKGTMTASEALKRLLRNSGYRAVKAGEKTYRIVGAPVRAAAPPRSPARIPAHEPPPPVPITVTASKRGLDLSEYPGGVQVTALAKALGGGTGTGLEDILSGFPQTTSTHLGAGRNKIFVRGVADSSFNGPTQSTIGLYLGEQRLIYSAPNPDLPLVDMDSVEMLEGPQGTLYGAGALGGVIRMVPRPPDPGGWEGRAWAGGAVTSGGEPGFDGAAMVNAPLGPRAAFRLVGYGEREGGYIADRARGLDDVNRGSLVGLRGGVRIDPGQGWRIALTGFAQRRRARDGQYIHVELPGLAQESEVAQPFRNAFEGGNLTIEGRIGAMSLVSVTGYVRNALDTRHDSSVLTGNGSIQAYDETRRIRMFSHETRLVSPRERPVSWVLGIALLENRDKYSQVVTSLGGGDPPPFANIHYRIREYALFGEATAKLSSRFAVTAGGRLIQSESSSLRLFGLNSASESSSGPVRFLPMAAITWRPAERLLAYARYQKGYRTGGVTVERALDGTPLPARFDPDRLWSAELGLRADLEGPVSGEVSFAGFYTRWTDIQADMVQAQGFPITRNIGDGWVAGLAASAELRFGKIWHLKAATFLNHSKIDRFTPQQTIASANLPNIADFSAGIEGGADFPLSRERTLKLGAYLRYYGKSYLDNDPLSRVPQGDYADTGIWASLVCEDWTATMALTNLPNTRGNRFAYGNPFTVRLAPQATPLRPRTLRFSVSRSF